jgi:hypothetical protein
LAVAVWLALTVISRRDHPIVWYPGGAGCPGKGATAVGSYSLAPGLASTS